MPDLRITSRTRSERLTDAETVELGRTLTKSLRSSFVSFPDDTSTAVAIVHDYSGDIDPEARRRSVNVLGDFDANEID